MQHTHSNIIDFLKAHALTSPDKTAFIFLESNGHAEEKMSYRILLEKVEMLACNISAQQLYGSRVMLLYQDVCSFIISFLACQYVGVIPVPVPYMKGARQVSRLSAIIEDACVETVLCNQETIPLLKRGWADFPWVKDIVILATDKLPEVKAQTHTGSSYHDISFIQYTSGSTGQPKGVVVSAKSLLHNQELISNTFGCNSDAVIFSWLPFHHDMGLIGNILHAVYVGCTCVLMQPFHFMQSPLRWLEAIGKYKVTHSGAPNFAYDLCTSRISPAEASRLDLSSWKVAYSGAEPVSAATLQHFASRFASAGFDFSAFYPCYGLAEATLLVSGCKQNQQPLIIYTNKNIFKDQKILLADKDAREARPLVSTGTVAQGMEVILIAGEQQLFNELEEGEICIAGESVTSGYWNKNNDSLFHLSGGKQFLRTGDLGFLYKGELFVHGRIKEMLIIRGQNFYPADMEQVIAAAHPSIDGNGVAVFSRKEMEEEVVVVVEIKRTLLQSLDAKEVIDSIHKAVNGYFNINPGDILLTTPLGIPRTTSGKLQRLKCSELYQQQELSCIASKRLLEVEMRKEDLRNILPGEVLVNSNYQTIRSYVVSLINTRHLPISGDVLQDDMELTEIGLDSLRAMELINTINKELSINMDAAQVFRLNTLGGLTNAIENMLWLKNGQTSGKEIII